MQVNKTQDLKGFKISFVSTPNYTRLLIPLNIVNLLFEGTLFGRTVVSAD